MKIILISYGLGGAEIMNCIYFAILKDYRYRNISVQNITISKFAKLKLNNYKYVKTTDILNYIKKEKLDIIINERSNGLDIQNKITKYCKKNNIKNIVLLDVHGNYKKRFVQEPDLIISPSKTITTELSLKKRLRKNV